MSYLFCFLFFFFGGKSNSVTIEVNAGDYKRTASPIVFDIPEQLREYPYFQLRNKKSNKTVPVQLIEKHKLTFILETPLEPGTQGLYELEGLKKPVDSEINVRVQADTTNLTLKIADQLVLKYWLEKQLPDGVDSYYQRSGFIHPLLSPKGQSLTDDFPVGHTHQHGLFFAWVNTTFRGKAVDFWNQHNKTGTIEHLSLDTMYSGNLVGGFHATLQHLSLEFGPILEEYWEVSVRSDGTNYILDLSSTHRNISTDTLYINQYRYGGLGIRGNRAWNAEDSLHYFSDLAVLTDTGLDRIKANHSKPDWIVMHGETGQGHPGLLALAHSENFNSPQTVRVHPQMPYFCYAPMVDSAFSIGPGQNFVSKYRLILFDYSENSLNSTSYSRDYQYPPVVKIW